MTSREFKALENGKIITKISIYGYSGDLIKTVPLDYAKKHKCIINSHSSDYNFTMEEVKHYIELGIADNYATVRNSDGTQSELLHAIRYFDLAYGKLVRQRIIKELGLKRIVGKKEEYQKLCNG